MARTEWLRPAVGGILLGVVLMTLPEMYGVGYPVVGEAIAGRYGIAFLLVLLVGKLVACSLTIGIGGSGGVFAPSLFCGAMAGAAFGDIVHVIAPQAGGSAGAYALVGMGAVFAGAARAPITAVVIMFELTGEYTIILPLMLAIVLATSVSELVSRDTIYTRKLLRRGIDVDEPADAAMRRRSASTVMVKPPQALFADTTLATAAAIFSQSGEAALPVIDRTGRYQGNLAARDLMDALVAADHANVAGLSSSPVPVRPEESLGEVIRRLDHGADAVPITNRDGILIGWVRHRDMLTALTNGRPNAGQSSR